MKKAIASACLFGMVVASVPAADVVEFRKVDYFEVVSKSNGEQDEEKRDARMETRPGRAADLDRSTRRTEPRRPPTRRSHLRT